MVWALFSEMKCPRVPVNKDGSNIEEEKSVDGLHVSFTKPHTLDRIFCKMLVSFGTKCGSLFFLSFLCYSFVILQQCGKIVGGRGNKLRFSKVLAAPPLWSTIDCNLPFSTPTLHYTFLYLLSLGFRKKFTIDLIDLRFKSRPDVSIEVCKVLCFSL